jgi:hypothetical protein
MSPRTVRNLSLDRTPRGELPSVYLCGAIGGRSLREASHWRQNAAKLLAPEFCVIDPLRDVSSLRPASSPKSRIASRETSRLFTDAEIIERDLMDIRHSYIVLRHYTGASEGSPMECAYAKMLGVPVVVSGIRDPATASPWLRYHSVRLLPTLTEAIRYIKAYWRPV